MLANFCTRIGIFCTFRKKNAILQHAFPQKTLPLFIEKFFGHASEETY